MPRVRIVHWKPAEAEPLLDACRAAGWDADCEPDASGPVVMQSIRNNPPDAIVIDLSRLPSHGRAVADWLRKTKKFAHIPVLFANGQTGISTARIGSALKTGRHAVPSLPPAPTRTVAQKLGIVPGTTVGVIDPPRDYLSILEALPENVEIDEDSDAIHPVVIWFVDDVDNLLLKLRRLRSKASRAKFWIVWPKGSKSGIKQNVIREAAIDAGLIDYRVCALGCNWSGLLFTRKKV